MIELRSVSKIFRTDIVETYALRDFGLSIGAGEFVAITGHSGSGKRHSSTSLACWRSLIPVLTILMART